MVGARVGDKRTIFVCPKCRNQWDAENGFCLICGCDARQNQTIAITQVLERRMAYKSWLRVGCEYVWVEKASSAE